MCGTVETVERDGVTSAVLSISWSNLCPTAESGWSSIGTHSVRQKNSSNSSSFLRELVTSVSIMPKLVLRFERKWFVQCIYLVTLSVHLVKYCVSFWKKYVLIAEEYRSICRTQPFQPNTVKECRCRMLELKMESISFPKISIQVEFHHGITLIK